MGEGAKAYYRIASHGGRRQCTAKKEGGRSRVAQAVLYYEFGVMTKMAELMPSWVGHLNKLLG